MSNRRLKFATSSLATLVILAVGGGSVGCAGAHKRTKEGALAGAAVGGTVGAATGGAKGAGIGAAAGGALGAAIGNYLERRQQELDQVVETEKTDRGLKITMKSDVLFGFDQSSLKSSAEQTLQELANILMKYPGDKLRIVGFTDDIGTKQYNQHLSEERAQTVKEFLSSNGVKPDRMNAVGLGEAPEPAKSPEGRQRNRRVEIFIDPQLPKQQG